MQQWQAPHACTMHATMHTRYLYADDFSDGQADLDTFTPMILLLDRQIEEAHEHTVLNACPI